MCGGALSWTDCLGSTKYMGDWESLLNDFGVCLGIGIKVAGQAASPLDQSTQVRNYTMERLKETFCVRFAVASDYDPEDADHLVTITAPAHYLKAMSIDLSKKGFEWHHQSFRLKWPQQHFRLEWPRMTSNDLDCF